MEEKLNHHPLTAVSPRSSAVRPLLACPYENQIAQYSVWDIMGTCSLHLVHLPLRRLLQHTHHHHPLKYIVQKGTKTNHYRITTYRDIILVAFLSLCVFRLVGNAWWGMTLLSGWRHSGDLVQYTELLCLFDNQ